MQVSDLSFPVMVDDESWPENSAMTEWSSLIVEAATKFGRFADSAKSYKAQMEAVGFQDLVEIQFKWPLNRWPKDKKMKEWGKCLASLQYYLPQPQTQIILLRSWTWTSGAGKYLGTWNHENIGGSLYAISVTLFTRGLGWTVEELEVFLVDVRKEMNDTKIHAYLPVYVVYGSKPRT